jgi:glycine/D-amino acid oxidase-like deaminating enzyme
VLVVGAGPTGLVLAAELLARGIRTRIIDQGDGVALQPWAIGIHARSLDILDTMGLAERFIERGHVVQYLRFYSKARCLASLEFPRCGSRSGDPTDPRDPKDPENIRGHENQIITATTWWAATARTAWSAGNSG